MTQAGAGRCGPRPRVPAASHLPVGTKGCADPPGPGYAVWVTLGADVGARQGWDGEAGEAPSARPCDRAPELCPFSPSGLAPSRAGAPDKFSGAGPAGARGATGRL